MKKIPNIIFEVANAHGGDHSVLLKSISEFGALEYPNKYIKFQPFKHETTALPDFSAYDIYLKLFFTNDEWKQVISLANDCFSGVLLDIIDLYSVDVLSENIDLIHAIKFQASILKNKEVLDAVSEINLSNKELILNVSGYNIKYIQNIIDDFSKIKCKKLILQAGFQSYPTKVENTSLNKIKVLIDAFPDVSICFADHLSADDEFSRILPLLAYYEGCDYLEKHVCISRKDAPYDGYSSLELNEMKQLLNNIMFSNKAYGNEFVCDAERDYLDKSIQIPVLRNDICAGQFISDGDVIYRRTNNKGLNIGEIQDLQKQGYILKSNKKKHDTIIAEDFKKSRIGVIVACRLKSTRLKQKAIIEIDGKAVIDYCLESCLRFPKVDEVILATSTIDEDKPLEKHLLDGKIKFWAGDADDVIDRYLGACKKYDLDIVYRMTGDNMFPSKEVAEIMLESHFASGADYTYTEDITIGITTEVYNVSTLEKIANNTPNANYSEYMNWYATNNSDYFKLNKVSMPKELIRDYRLTLDYSEDLEMFIAMIAEIRKQGLSITTENIFAILDSNPNIANINKNISQFYSDNSDLIEVLKSQTRFAS